MRRTLIHAGIAFLLGVGLVAQVLQGYIETELSRFLFLTIFVLLATQCFASGMSYRWWLYEVEKRRQAAVTKEFTPRLEDIPKIVRSQIEEGEALCYRIGGKRVVFIQAEFYDRIYSKIFRADRYRDPELLEKCGISALRFADVYFATVKPPVEPPKEEEELCAAFEQHCRDRVSFSGAEAVLDRVGEIRFRNR